ncbi:MAG: PilZ domain-containing protein [Candidatus Aminicenantes bacterium]|nr:PilZ domain-containing protein [Candidatus Aminicenantes bacterium]
MDKRKDRRIKKRLMAKINDHSSILVDISRNGFKFSTAAIPKNRNVNITLQVNNQTFNLKGYTRWISQKVTTQQLYEIGVTIEEASQEYYQFLDQLLPQQPKTRVES